MNSSEGTSEGTLSEGTLVQKQLEQWSRLACPRPTLGQAGLDLPEALQHRTSRRASRDGSTSLVRSTYLAGEHPVGYSGAAVARVLSVTTSAVNRVAWAAPLPGVTELL